MKYLLEICTGSADSVTSAFRGGADRVELCCGLEEGGLTPSVGMIRNAVEQRDAMGAADGKHAVNVLIRPRGGDFLYTKKELDIMLDDIRFAAGHGVDGIVVGALTADGHVDTTMCRRFVREARGCKLTFHRAFDMCCDPVEALEAIIDMGFHRVLTSGLAATAEEGAPLLQRLVEQAHGRISIMPGCGVNSRNAARILQTTGAHELHASARSVIGSLMQFRRDGVEMGRADADEFARKETDAAEVQKLRAVMDEAERHFA